MTIVNFQSGRGAAAVANDPQPVADSPPIKTRTIVVSPVAGMAEAVARSLSRDDSLDVRFRQLPLDGLAQDPDFDPDSTDLIIFHIREACDGDLAALRGLRADTKRALKFLGVTSEPLSLATARALMDAGVDEVMPLAAQTPSMDRTSAIEPAARIAQDRRGGTTHDGIILSAIGARGGAGVTSFALNIATLLARPTAKGAIAPRVAVVDLDFQNGVLGAAIDMRDGGAYLDILRDGRVPDHDFVATALTRFEAGGFDVLAAPASFAPLGALTPQMVAALLDELRLAYDHVVLDLPRALVDWIEPILNRTDRFCILGDTSVHTVRQTRRMIDTYLGESASLPLSLIVSQDRKRLGTSAAVKEAQDFLGRPFDTWVPADLPTAQKATDQGLPMALVKPKSPAVRALLPLVNEIVELAATGTRRRA